MLIKGSLVLKTDYSGETRSMPSMAADAPTRHIFIILNIQTTFFLEEGLELPVPSQREMIENGNTYLCFLKLIQGNRDWDGVECRWWKLRFRFLKLTRCGQVTPYCDRELGQHWPGNGLLPDTSKPLPENSPLLIPMFIYHPRALSYEDIKISISKIRLKL